MIETGLCCITKVIFFSEFFTKWRKNCYHKPMQPKFRHKLVCRTENVKRILGRYSSIYHLVIENFSMLMKDQKHV